MSAGPAVRCAVRPGSYYDSVVLMQLQRALAALPGVLDAGVMMATPTNLEVLAASGLAPGAGVTAGPHDLLITVKADSDAAAGEALARVDALLQVRRTGGEEDFRPRSLASALKMLPEARWVLVSVPGRHAAGVAEEALGHGRNVFLYSDNVPVESEVALKRKARERGLLVLGPDCGTAVIGGVGFGFANRVRRGPVGLIGASGTGLQAVMSHLHALGSGISQAIGTGGRDLSAEVGGITALQALDLLSRDPETKVIVLISKPPAPEVAARLLGLARSAGKPVVVYFLGAPLPGRKIGNLHFAASLSEAAELAIQAPAVPGVPAVPAVPCSLRGLFSGGTLAQEVLLGLSAILPPDRYQILDLGDDEYTVGRLHPMIDQDLRLRLLRQEASSPETSLILLDVVLGEGAHADPAGELAPAIEEARSRRPELEVAALVIGTGEDPQGLENQIETLERAGAHVFRTAGELVDFATQRSPGSEETGKPVPLEPVGGAINIGLESFYDSLVAQGTPAVQVDWKPPAGGNEKLAAILARMKNA
ncbi:MAG TPA: acyl-CoA synthetase FdrA [Thermoanaerobaculia bacterium]|nr:acyl-CoA synthetase FdrA [Thermoanaerobaculia bacterium]